MPGAERVHSEESIPWWIFKGSSAICDTLDLARYRVQQNDVALLLERSGIRDYSEGEDLPIRLQSRVNTDCAIFCGVRSQWNRVS